MIKATNANSPATRCAAVKFFDKERAVAKTQVPPDRWRLFETPVLSPLSFGLQEILFVSPLIEKPDRWQRVGVGAGREFLAGGKGSDEGGGPFAVELPAFYLGLHPVTNAQYQRFVEATKHRHRTTKFWQVPRSGSIR